MVTHTPELPKNDLLPGEAEVARLYREGGRDAPPSKLDAQILAAAHAAVQPAHPPRKRWAAPLSTAAVVVLAVSVVLLMTKEGTPDRNGGLAPNEFMAPRTSESPVPASVPPLADARDAGIATEPARAKHTAPEPGKPAAVAETVDSSLARQAPAEAKKKAEIPAASSPPPALGRTAEMDRASPQREESTRSRLAAAGVAAMKSSGADVIAVQASGSPGAYSFNVTVKSPDTGCQQYADWWEVLSEDGKLLYRRVLLHSHVGEQPFTRSGGPVPIQPDTVVWVRAHMNISGFGGAVQKGSVKGGFKPAVLDAGFAAGVAKQQPLPDGCAF